MDVKTSVDTILKAAVASHGIPSLVVTVIQNGKIAFQKAYGNDPLYTFATNSPSNTYAMGPASQVLTGVAILYLQEDGKLSLDDPVGKYLPDVPEEWRAITLKQFLTHRSGIPALPADAKSFAAAVEAAGKQPMRFKPGAQQGDNSADYDILGQVIAKVTNESYIVFMQKVIFKQMKFGATGDYNQLLFRFVAPQDFRFDGTQASFGNVTASGVSSASSMSGRQGMAGYDPTGQGHMVELLQRGIPDYSIPSKGLASNVQDIIRISSAIFDANSFKPFSDPDYLSMAPGWKACSTGKDTLLTDIGFGGAGYGINLTLIPNRKVALILVWKTEKGTEKTNLRDESQDIMDTALGIPISNWVCTGTDEEPDDDQQ